MKKCDESCKYADPNGYQCNYPNMDLVHQERDDGKYGAVTRCDGYEPKIHDSGERQQFETGAVRDPSKGKGRFDLLPPAALFRDAIWMELGAAKYTDRNWERGIPISRCFDSAMRHMVKYLAGDTSEDHLAAARWNIAAIMHFEAEMPEMQDLPKWK